MSSLMLQTHWDVVQGHLSCVCLKSHAEFDCTDQRKQPPWPVDEHDLGKGWMAPDRETLTGASPGHSLGEHRES